MTVEENNWFTIVFQYFKLRTCLYKKKYLWKKSPSLSQGRILRGFHGILLYLWSTLVFLEAKNLYNPTPKCCVPSVSGVRIRTFFVSVVHHTPRSQYTHSAAAGVASIIRTPSVVGPLFFLFSSQHHHYPSARGLWWGLVGVGTPPRPAVRGGASAVHQQQQVKSTQVLGLRDRVTLPGHSSAFPPPTSSFSEGPFGTCHHWSYRSSQVK